MTLKVGIFFAFTPEDEIWRAKLEKHLRPLQRQGLISTWDEEHVLPGNERASEIYAHLQTAQIILLLISADFLASDFCRGVEIKEAIRRHEHGEACVIPILVRPVIWNDEPFGNLQPLPRNFTPISKWSDHDEALSQVGEGIRQVITEWNTQRTKPLSSSSPFVYFPYDRNSLFTGRIDVLERIHQTFQAGKTPASTQPCALIGLGGIGKTQIVVEYAYRYQFDYQNIFWIKAHTIDTLTAGFATLARLLRLSLHEDKNQLIEDIRHWFQEHNDWLLIFDNADFNLLISGFLPSQGNGHILITTRTPLSRKIAYPIEVDIMNPEEGALLLLRRSGLLELNEPIDIASSSDIDLAKRIVQEMGGLPLALDQAGAFIEETKCSLYDYFHLFQMQQKDLLKRRGRVFMDHPDSVSTTFSLSFKKLQEASPATANLLQLLAFLGPYTIPEGFLTNGAAALSPDMRSVTTNKLKFQEVISEALNYSLIRRNPDQTLTMHPLVQIVIKHGMSNSLRRRWAERAVKAMSYCFSVDSDKNWLNIQQYIPHLLTLASLIDELDMTFPEAINLLVITGDYLHSRMEYGQAELLYKRALAMNESSLDPDHLNTAINLTQLALLYEDMGDREGAEPLYQRALSINERLFGLDHPQTITILNNLARLYQLMGNYERAEPLYQRVLALREQVLGSDHALTISTLNTLADLYQLMSNYEGAEPLYQRALSINERLFGLDHPQTITILNNLARLYQLMGNYERAEPLYQRVLALREQVLGSDHPNTAMAINTLARFYWLTDRYEQAEVLYECALTIYDRKFGPDHFQTKLVSSYLEEIHHSMARKKQTDEIVKKG